MEESKFAAGGKAEERMAPSFLDLDFWISGFLDLIKGFGNGAAH